MTYQKIIACFEDIYGTTLEPGHLEALIEVLDTFKLPSEIPSSTLTANDAILITYGDAIQSGEQSPLQTLRTFLETRVRQTINTVHLLPFFPYSSDDGFSVIDYTRVDPNLGDWEDIEDFAASYDLIFDAVINHISVKSDWFEGFLSSQPPYDEYFITIAKDTDLSDVFRPRALPLLTKFDTVNGTRYVWTTFSKDQVDLNFHNPDVLIDIARILLMFVERGARFIRLDAIAYIWKEIGTSCIHLGKTHRIVQFFRLIFDELAPYVQIITETNVPHGDNISYFGDGTDEAQLVYNFSLPPLVLHAFHHQNATTLTRWAKSLALPSSETSFFNFLASHDGVGVTPAKGLIPDEDIHELCRRVEALGGFVSYKNNADGTRSPYELNISYLDALGDPDHPDEPAETVADRFLASQSIMLALKGVPGVYYHSLLGSRGWREGVKKTGRNRTINREKLALNNLLEEIDQQGSLRQCIFDGYLKMLGQRGGEAGQAFDPTGQQQLLELDHRLFSVLRGSQDGNQWVLCVTNVTPGNVLVEISPAEFLKSVPNNWLTLLSRNSGFSRIDSRSSLQIGPYGVLWLFSEKG
jgi:sucrose phosphorylase